MATVYWYGGSGNWSDYTNHWSNNSGNSPSSNHGATPGTDDDVVFDSGSASDNYTVTIDATANCQNFTMDKPTGVGKKITLAGTSDLNIYGSVTLTGGTAGITLSYTGNILFCASTTGKTINPNGLVFSSQISFNGSGGGWTLQDTLDNVSVLNTKNILYTAGDLNTGNQTINARIFRINSGTKTFTMGSSAINCWYFYVNSATGYTLPANTSTITISGTTDGYIYGGGKTYYNLVLSGNGANAVNDSNTFNNITIPAGKEVNFKESTNTTVTSFTALGTSGSHIVIHSTSATDATLTKAGGGTITGCDYIDFTDIVGSPDLTWYVGANSTATGCTNIYTEIPPATTNIKTLNTNLYANIKTYNTNAIANVKSINTNV